jgi:hypothetical protein
VHATVDVHETAFRTGPPKLFKQSKFGRSQNTDRPNVQNPSIGRL